MNLARYRKAFAVLIGGALGVAGLFIPGIEDAVKPEMVMALSTVLATVAVYVIPNAA